MKDVDHFPKTLVLLRHVGIGDLIWHLPFIREIAAKSQGGKVSIIAAPSTRAPEILAAETCIDQIFLYDRNPRRTEATRGKHSGFLRMFKFARGVAQHRFDRVFLFSSRYHHAILAFMAGIPVRAGFGTNRIQRFFLNTPPFIKKYQGPRVDVFENSTTFALAHHIVDTRPIPKMRIADSEILFGQQAIAALPRPVVAFAIGSSEKHKHWGDAHFAQLAHAITAAGYGVALLGGPAESARADGILQHLPAEQRARALGFTQNTIMQTAGILLAADCCIGNDTGVLNMAAALDRPAICILGKRPLLSHDPLIHCITHAPLTQITVDEVLPVLLHTLSQHHQFAHSSQKMG